MTGGDILASQLSLQLPYLLQIGRNGILVYPNRLTNLKEEGHVSETEGITLGNAGYGLRHFSMREFFETSKKMGLPAVEAKETASDDDRRR